MSRITQKSIFIGLAWVILSSPAFSQDQSSAPKKPQKKSKAVSVLLKELAKKRDSKQYESVIQQASAFLKKTKNYEVLIERGWSYALLKKYKDSHADYTAAIALQEKNYKAYAHRGWMLWTEGKSKQALNDLNKALELNPKDEKSRYHKVECYFALEDKAEAIKASEEYVKFAKDKSHAQFILATAYSRYQELEKALAACDKSLEINPKSAQALNLRGFIKLQRKDKRGFNDIYKATQLEPKTLAFQVNLAGFLRQYEYYEEAIPFYNNAIALDSKNDRYYYARGDCLDHCQRSIEAIEDLKTAVKLAPKDCNNLYFLASLYFELGDYYSALDTLGLIEKLKPKYPGLHALKCCCFSKQKQFNECVESAKFISPEAPGADHWEYVAKANLALNKLSKAASNLATAQAILAKKGVKKYTKQLAALRKKPVTAADYCTRALIRAKLENHEGAIKDYEEAIKLDPKNESAIYNKAAFLNFNHRPKEALQTAKLGLKFHPDSAYLLMAYCESLIDLWRLEEAKKIAVKVKPLNPRFGSPLLETIERYGLIVKRLEELDRSNPKQVEVYQAFKAAKKGRATAKQLGLVGGVLLRWKVPKLYILSSLNRCLRLDASLSEFRLLKANCLCESRLYQDAYYETTVAQRLKANPIQVLYAQGAIASGKGDYQGSNELYSRVIKLDPKLSYPWRRRADNFERLGDPDSAIEAHKKSIEVDPKAGYSYSNLGRLHVNKGLLEQGLHYYTLGVKVEPKSSMAHYNRGWANGLLERWVDAIEDYSKALKINPKRRDALINRGNAYRTVGKPDKAIADYSSLTKYYPHDYVGYYQRAKVFANAKKDYKTAISDYAKSIELNPNNLAAYYLRGEAYFYLENYKKAEEDFERSLRSRQHQLPALVGRAACRAKLGKFKEAIEDCDIIIRYAPQEVSAYINRAYCRVELGEYEAAVKDASKAISTHPREASAFRIRGRAYLGIKKFKEAKSDFDEAIELNPKHAKGYLFRARLYERQNEFKRMVIDYKEALKRDKRLTECYLKIAKGLCQMAAKASKEEDVKSAFKDATDYLLKAKEAKLWDPKLDKSEIFKELKQSDSYKGVFAPKKQPY